MGRKIKRNSNKINRISKYLPVLIILMSITIIFGSTFAYFTDKKEATSELHFAKVELSNETTMGINGKVENAIPGTPLLEDPISFSKSIDSEALYVRAKLSFSLPVEFRGDEKMVEFINLIRESTDFNIKTVEQNNAVWSAKQGNYYYLLDNTNTYNLKRVDDIFTYTLSEEIVFPRDIKQLDDNYQYMKSVNFHVAFEAIQADNVSAVLNDTIPMFNTTFPEVEAEKYVESGFELTIMNSDLTSVNSVIKVADNETTIEPIIELPVDGEGTHTKAVEGWYTDSEFENRYTFGNKLSEDLTLYPKLLEVSSGLMFSEITGERARSVTSYAVSKGTCNDAVVVIPAIYKGLPVTKIDNYAFADMENGNMTLTNIVMPNSIDTIGEAAFAMCVNLNFNKWPSNLSVIDMGAFIMCTSLTINVIPKDVVLGQAVFAMCTSLPNNGSVMYMYYEGTDNILVISAVSTDITTVTWPGSVVAIEAAAFEDCANLNFASLPDTLEVIGLSAFRNCTSLTLTSLPESVTYIGPEAFVDCTSLALTSLPEGITTIGNYTFQNCGELALTSIPESVEYIGYYAFDHCKKIKLTSLPSGLTYIGEYAFDGCSSLALTSLPEGLTEIENGVFSYCRELALTSLPDSIKKIGASAFSDCTKMRLNKLPASLESLGSGAFSNCVLNITSIPNSIQEVLIDPFTSSSYVNMPNNGSVYYLPIDNSDEYVIIKAVSTSMTTVTWPGKVRIITGNAFTHCKSLNITELPDDIIYIGSYSFRLCESMQLTRLPSKLKRIAYNAFYGCTSLALTTLPASVEGIEMDAFGNCPIPNNGEVSYLQIEGTNSYAIIEAIDKTITSINVPGEIGLIAGNAFQGCTSLVITSIPENIKILENQTFINCDSIKIIIDTGNVEKLMHNVFANCVNLKLIKLQSNIKYISDSTFTETSSLEYVLCDTNELVDMVKFLNFIKLSTVYLLQDGGYENVNFETEILDGIEYAVGLDVNNCKWVRIGDTLNGYQYYKLVY